MTDENKTEEVKVPLIKTTERSFGMEFKGKFLSGTLILIDNRPNNPPFIENFYLFYDGVEYERIEHLITIQSERTEFDIRVRKLFST
jgi:hypothetical protein